MLCISPVVLNISFERSLALHDYLLSFVPSSKLLLAPRLLVVLLVLKLTKVLVHSFAMIPEAKTASTATTGAQPPPDEYCLLSSNAISLPIGHGLPSNNIPTCGSDGGDSSEMKMIKKIDLPLAPQRLNLVAVGYTVQVSLKHQPPNASQRRIYPRHDLRSARMLSVHTFTGDVIFSHGPRCRKRSSSNIVFGKFPLPPRCVRKFKVRPILWVSSS